MSRTARSDAPQSLRPGTYSLRAARASCANLSRLPAMPGASLMQ